MFQVGCVNIGSVITQCSAMNELYGHLATHTYSLLAGILKGNRETGGEEEGRRRERRERIGHLCI